MTMPVFPTRKLALFALLSLADLALTRYLLETRGLAVSESNPLAAWWLERFGWLGLTGFKLAMMALAAGLGLMVYRRRPVAGHRVLGFGCAAVAAVVLYSGCLCAAVTRQPNDVSPGAEPALLAESDHLDAQLRRSREYRAALNDVVRDLRARKCNLEEAVASLTATELARDPRWLSSFPVAGPSRGPAECVALSVLNHLEGEADAPLADDLRAEFFALYGRPAPTPTDPCPVNAPAAANSQ
jgi:hypothetical protein